MQPLWWPTVQGQVHVPWTALVGGDMDINLEELVAAWRDTVTANKELQGLPRDIPKQVWDSLATNKAKQAYNREISRYKKE